MGEIILQADPRPADTSIQALLVSTQAAVPEPASWAMTIGGLALAGGALRGGRARRTLLLG